VARAAGRADRGGAVVDFVLVSVLLVLLLFGVLQVAVYFYARNIVAASTADAARFAATAGTPASAGVARAHALMSAGLSASVTRAVRCTAAADRDGASGLPVTTVHCAGRMRAFLLPVFLPLTLDATSSALTEGSR
jgi:Flp pilus assembly protein TadG